MNKASALLAGFALVLLGIGVSPCWAMGPSDFDVNEKINMHDFTFTEQVLPGANGTLGYAFLLSNCPRKGCVTLSGTYRMSDHPYTTLLIEGSDCRPKIDGVEINGMFVPRIILTVPSDPACAGVPQTAAGEYFPICHWDAPVGDLSWTGWHKNYRCWTEAGKPFLVGPH